MHAANWYAYMMSEFYTNHINGASTLMHFLYQVQMQSGQTNYHNYDQMIQQVSITEELLNWTLYMQVYTYFVKELCTRNW